MNDEVQGHLWQRPRRDQIWTRYHALAGYVGLLTVALVAVVGYQMHVNREMNRIDRQLHYRDYTACLARNQFMRVQRKEALWVGNILKAQAMQPKQASDLVNLWSAIAAQELAQYQGLHTEDCT